MNEYSLTFRKHKVEIFFLLALFCFILFYPLVSSAYAMNSPLANVVISHIDSTRGVETVLSSDEHSFSTLDAYSSNFTDNITRITSRTTIYIEYKITNVATNAIVAHISLSKDNEMKNMSVVSVFDGVETAFSSKLDLELEPRETKTVRIGIRPENVAQDANFAGTLSFDVSQV